MWRFFLPFLLKNLRLDSPLLLSRWVSRFAPINANCAPLTARTAGRLAPQEIRFPFIFQLGASSKLPSTASSSVFSFLFQASQAFDVGKLAPQKSVRGSYSLGRIVM
jgi:hypothetical protein